MSFTITGKVEKIMDVQSGTSKAGKEWQRREFVINTDEQYNPFLQFSCFGDKVSLLEGKKEGDVLEITFNLFSREYNEKYYTQAQAWIIKDVQPAPPKAATKEESDLPF